MPISGYFSGSGDKVMSSMQKTYGPKKAKQVFYATANARNANPGQKIKKMHSPKGRTRR